MDPVAELLFDYLSDVIYNPENSKLDISKLPEAFQDFGKGLLYFTDCVKETKSLAQALAKGELNTKIPSSGNEIASPLKSLHASLKHLTWQTQQVAQGDYQQRVKFMGDFAQAFNMMASQLEERSKQASRERSQLQQYISLILSNVPDIMLIFDSEGKVVLASDTFFHIFGADLNSVRGKTFGELMGAIVSKEISDHMEALISRSFSSSESVQTEQSIDFNNDGNIRDYIINVSRMSGENDVAMGTMVIFHDMTEKIQAQRESERAREAAVQSTKAKSEFLARMSHEMRTPMNAIIGMTSIGMSADDPEKKANAFQRIDDASKHLLGVINDILDMSKIEADKLELYSHEFNFESMLSHINSMVFAQVSANEQTFTLSLDEDLPAYIIADEQRLAQVIANLLSNAVKFTPRFGSISLIISKESETEEFCELRFEVKDTGIGVTEEQKKNLFMPFEQADGSISRQYGGTGLGLSISKRIIELMGGRIWVESVSGAGSSFIFVIKVKKGDGSSHVITEEDFEDAGVLLGKRILIAEDVEVNREIVAALLENTGVEMTFAVDGQDALEKYTSFPYAYDLILMDIQMPVVDGYEATKRIRASGIAGAQSVPIIAMTANVFREDIERCLAVGMNGHLGKPIDIQEVISKLKEYLLRAPREM